MEIVPNCNVCGSELIHKVDPDYNLCSCSSCGYVFDSPRPTLDELIRFYSQPAKYDPWLEQVQARDALWRRRIKKLASERTAGNLLDVGTGIGQFLHHAKPFFTEVHGTEVSESAIRIAREKYGLEIYQGVVEELNLPSTSFDNITLFHVLEHVPDPVKLVQRCQTLLRPNGILLVAVPNDVLAWTSAIKRLGKFLGLRAFQKFSPILGIPKAGTSKEIHISHFTPAVLRQLLERCGFSLLQESLDPYYAATGVKLIIHTAYYSIHRLLWTLFKVNRYDTIWMVARKPEDA